MSCCKTKVLVATAAMVIFVAAQVTAQTMNKVAGTWKMIDATVESNGMVSYPYGPEPQGKLVFTCGLHFVEFLHDPRIPRFESNERGEGTNEENRLVMESTLALYGRYTVDSDGNFSGNTVEGSSFPNWIGDVRTTNELTMVVEGNRMTESFQRPSGARVKIIWERVEPAVRSVCLGETLKLSTQATPKAIALPKSH